MKIKMMLIVGITLAISMGEPTLIAMDQRPRPGRQNRKPAQTGRPGGRHADPKKKYNPQLEKEARERRLREFEAQIKTEKLFNDIYQAVEQGDLKTLAEIIDPSDYPEYNRYSEYPFVQPRVMHFKPNQEVKFNIALTTAARFENLAVTTFLLDRYPALASNPETLEMLLHDAVWGKQLGQVKLAVSRGVSVNEPWLGLVPLKIASMQGDTAIITFLIRHGADISYESKSIVTGHPENALAVALKSNHLETATALLTTIPYETLSRLKTAILSIRFTTPTPPRDIRKLLTQRLTAQFAQEHMAKVTQLLQRTASLLASEQTRQVDQQARDDALEYIRELQSPESLQSLQRDIEADIRLNLR